MIITYKGKTPEIGKNVFIAPTAVVIGDVKIGDDASIWYGVVIRGDMASITIGRKTNIQDNCTVHTDAGFPAEIGDRVTVGHNAVVHGCAVEDDALVGIGSVVLNGSRVGRGSVVASGSVVREGQTISPRSLMAGVPAKLKKELTKEDAALFSQPMKNYLELSKAHQALPEI
ncbi:MAG: gamma carbonic anhydrase family protein [Desulfobacterales bacterium]|nr:gamma carbonic anhydrase family protein [Desulfobacterales bacterium]